MTRGKYMAGLDVLTSTARALLQVAETVDVAAMRRVCGEMEAVAPITEPTAYARGGGRNLSDQAAFLAAVDRFVTDVKKLDRREEATRG